MCDRLEVDARAPGVRKVTMNIFDVVPLAAAACAIPQFVPQLRRTIRDGATEGVSWAWAALTSVGNAGWTVYFAWSGYWSALVPSVSASSMAAVLAVFIARAIWPDRRAVVLCSLWAGLLAAVAAVGGRTGLGAALSVAFVVQVTPAVWTAYRARVPRGVAVGTWWLVLGELSCWAVYGLHQNDQRLVFMGATGIVAALAMIFRAVTAGRRSAQLLERPMVGVVTGS